mmetsp:Transcript_99621/g.168045  ORF Transcript_99621/g.168045 Transcript_99621/m.168045 type:complete len:90 (+) Transcript_99621:830-1099(+)
MNLPLWVSIFVSQLSILQGCTTTGKSHGISVGCSRLFYCNQKLRNQEDQPRCFFGAFENATAEQVGLHLLLCVVYLWMFWCGPGGGGVC